jgi:hypothetical protein
MKHSFKSDFALFAAAFIAAAAVLGADASFADIVGMLVADIGLTGAVSVLAG